MPYSRPSLTQLQTQVLQQINAAQITDQSGNVLVMLLQRSILRVVAYAEAGMTYELYAYLDWIALQAVPWTAIGEFLDGWANLKGVYREAATATQGTATFVCTNNSGIPAGAAIVRADGATFVTTAAALPSSGSVTVSITSMFAGSAGNFDAGTVFRTGNAIAGVGATSIASTQTVAGADQELDPALRTRMLAAYASPPQGGAASDYVQWALAVPGVTRAWIAPLTPAAGAVTVYTMFDLAEAAHGGFPQGANGVATAETRATAATGDQLTVANAIFPLRPVTALVYSDAPTAAPQAFAIADLGSNNTAAMQASINAALTGMFLQYGNVGGTINPVSSAAWPAIPPSAWYAALEAIPGLTQFEVTSPTTPITVTAGQLPTLGTITFAT